MFLNKSKVFNGVINKTVSHLEPVPTARFAAIYLV